MSERREVATKPSSVAFSPAMKREFFHASKYSLIVGVITVIAVKASDGVGSNAWASSSRLCAWLSNSAAAAAKMSASGTPSPKSTLPLPSTSPSTPLARKSGLVP